MAEVAVNGVTPWYHNPVDYRLPRIMRFICRPPRTGRNHCPANRSRGEHSYNRRTPGSRAFRGSYGDLHQGRWKTATCWNVARTARTRSGNPENSCRDCFHRGFGRQGGKIAGLGNPLKPCMACSPELNSEACCAAPASHHWRDHVTRSAFLKHPRHEFHQVAGTRTVVELVADQPAPAGPAGARGTRQAEDESRIGNTGYCT